MSEFILVKHDAEKAGTHYDLRFKKPDSKGWVSFATPSKSREEPPPEKGEKMTLIRTEEHSEEEAKFTGKIKEGYGKGTIKKVDGGKCEVKKFKDSHMVVDFKGSKIKGVYQFVNVAKFSKSSKSADEEKRYVFFKGDKESD